MRKAIFAILFLGLLTAGYFWYADNRIIEQALGEGGTGTGTVKFIYFLPSDVDETELNSCTIRNLMVYVQNYYADQLDNGNSFETYGIEPIVVKSSYPASYFGVISGAYIENEVEDALGINCGNGGDYRYFIVPFTYPGSWLSFSYNGGCSILSSTHAAQLKYNDCDEVYGDCAMAISASVHEIGHIFGLQHPSPADGSMMSGGPYLTTDFNAGDLAILDSHDFLQYNYSTTSPEDCTIYGEVDSLTTDYLSPLSEDANYELEATNGLLKMAQAFTGDGRQLGQSAFYLEKIGSATGTLVSKLYEISGTYGTDAIPSGEPLVVSNSVLASTTPDWRFDFVYFTFSGDQQYTLASGTKYAISIEYGAGNLNNYIYVRTDSDNDHDGNYSRVHKNAPATWSVPNTRDLIFIVNAAESEYSLFDGPTITIDGNYNFANGVTIKQ